MSLCESTRISVYTIRSVLISTKPKAVCPALLRRGRVSVVGPIYWVLGARLDLEAATFGRTLRSTAQRAVLGRGCPGRLLRIRGRRVRADAHAAAATSTAWWTVMEAALGRGGLARTR